MCKKCAQLCAQKCANFCVNFFSSCVKFVHIFCTFQIYTAFTHHVKIPLDKQMGYKLNTGTFLQVGSLFFNFQATLKLLSFTSWHFLINVAHCGRRDVKSYQILCQLVSSTQLYLTINDMTLRRDFEFQSH